jgi:hypothetical protein
MILNHFFNAGIKKSWMQTLKSFAFAGILFVFLSFSTVHPFYVSITDMYYKKDESAIQIAQRIFWDDLEVALAGSFGVQVDFLANKPEGKLDDMIEQYLLKHNSVVIDGHRQNIEYLGYEIEDDVAWFYMIAKNVSKPRSVRLRNSVLTDFFPDQKNIINFYLGDKPKSVITNKRKPEKTLDL